MNGFFRNILLVFLTTNILSCTPSAPYEIRSPCVAVDGSDHTYGINPCIRRPINYIHDFA